MEFRLCFGENWNLRFHEALVLIELSGLGQRSTQPPLDPVHLSTHFFLQDQHQQHQQSYHQTRRDSVADFKNGRQEEARTS